MLTALHDLCLRMGCDKTYWVAYSGGLDSRVLLALCTELRSQLPIKLRAIHINHSVSPHADHWAAHCAKTCEEHGIDYITRTIQVNCTAGDSFEEVAREQRYALFAAFLQEDDVLLTAHHQDDQAETVLLQLFRGAGPKGLSAMPQSKPFAKGYHVRPLLPFPRAMLEHYAHQHQLVWVDDESNHQIKLTRNYIRHQIMPLLKQRWPTVSNAISRSAAHCAESQVLLEEFALAECEIVKGSQPNTLSVAKLLGCDPARQRWLLRAWIEQQGYPLPDARKLESVRTDVLTAGWDRLPCVKWGGVEIRRYRDDLYVLHSLPHQTSTSCLQWDLIAPLVLPDVGILQVFQAIGKGLRANVKQVEVRFRQGGEKINLLGRGRQILKNLMQEWNIQPWLRDRIPLIFIEDKLVCVVGYAIDPHYAASGIEKGYELKVEMPPSPMLLMGEEGLS